MRSKGELKKKRKIIKKGRECDEARGKKSLQGKGTRTETKPIGGKGKQWRGRGTRIKGKPISK